jgi:hypothetical protein
MTMQLNPGTYFGKLVSADLCEIGQNKTPAFALAFNVTHMADNADGWRPLDNVTRDVIFWLTDKSKEYAFADLQKLGFNADWDNPKFDPKLTDGVELLITVETYNGKVNEKCAIAMLMQRRERDKVPSTVKQQLAAQYRMTVQATAKPTTPPPRAAMPTTTDAPPSGISKTPPDVSNPPF